MNKISYKEYIKAFIIGSSICGTIFPLVLIASANARNGNHEIRWPTISIFFPIVLGLPNLIALFVGAQRTMLKMLCVGAILGLMLSSYGLFVLNYPEIVYGLKGAQRYRVLLLAPIFYGLVFSIPVHLANTVFKE